MFFSIVIPVYNVKEYLNRCVDSVLSQKFSDLEIILVDDGSTDGSGEQCDALQLTDTRINVIHQNNGGLSAARNTGIAHAKGQYIILLDSDDCLIEESLEVLKSKILDTTCDVLVGYAFSIDEKGNRKEKGKMNGFPEKVMTGCEYAKELDNYRKKVTFCAPFMVYASNFIKENHLEFYNGILHEDELWTPLAILKAKRIKWINVPFYYHYVRSGSIMHSGNYERKAESMITICKALSAEYHNYNENYLKYLKDRMIMIYLTIAPHLENPNDYRQKLGRFFTIKNAKHIDTWFKSALFSVSTYAYKGLYNKAFDR